MFIRQNGNAFLVCFGFFFFFYISAHGSNGNKHTSPWYQNLQVVKPVLIFVKGENRKYLALNQTPKIRLTFKHGTQFPAASFPYPFVLSYPISFPPALTPPLI